MRRFTKTHEWIDIDGDIGTVGITLHAVEQLGDLVFVEVKPAGTALEAGQQAVTVESVKAAAEVYAPVAGAITEANPAAAEDPSIVNSDPLGAGWLYRMRLSDPGAAAALMEEDAYNQMVLAG